MRALTVTHHEFSKKKLLEIAEETQGAWVGIRIAGYLLMLSGWKPPQVAELFGVSRPAAVKWCNKANKEGLAAVFDQKRSGRPSQFDGKILKAMNAALSKSPYDFGITRTRWDGVLVTHYLKRQFGIEVHVRHAQRLIRLLGYSLRQPIYQYAQATNRGVKKFHTAIKKTQLGEKGSEQKSSSVR
jgi:transposase